MEILFVSAGNSIHTVRWVNALSERGHNVYLVYNKGHSPTENKINPKVKCYEMKYGGSLAYYLNAKELNEIIKKLPIDIVNVHYASGYGTLARRAKIKNVILSVWGSDVYEFPYQSKIKSKILEKNLLHAKKIISTSECMARQIKKLLNDEKIQIEITPFGVDIAKFNPDLFTKSRKSKLVLGNIKSLKATYAIDDFIRAISVLIEKLKIYDEKIIGEISVEIYGDGELREYLNSLILEIGLQNIIALKGKIPNEQVPEKLAEFDIFCATSIKESFGVSIVEAMAMKIPTVVTDAEGFKEVSVHGETGLIVPKQNVEEIAQAILELILTPELRKTYGENGRKRVLKYYDWNENVRKMEAIYFSFYSKEVS